MDASMEKASRIFGLVSVLIFLLIGASQAVIMRNLDVLGSMWFVILLAIAVLFGATIWKPGSPIIFSFAVIALILSLAAAMMYINQGMHLQMLFG